MTVVEYYRGAKPSLLAVAILFLLWLLPTCALASCTDGAAPSYSDITSVMFERHGCGGFIHKPDDLKCSWYWVYFGNYWKTTYSQHTNSLGVGGFTSDASLEDARQVLQRHDFFTLAPPDRLVTDIAYSILTVRRCNVVQRILMYPIVQTTVQQANGNQIMPIGGDAAVAALLADFDSLVARSKKQKVTDHPLYFDLNVFDPDIYVPGPCRQVLPQGVAGCVVSLPPPP